MFNDDFFDEDFRDIDDLLIEFNKIKKGEPHGLISEDDFEFLLDFFESNNDTENLQIAFEICITLYPFAPSLLIRKAEWLTDHKKFGQALKVLDQLEEIDPKNIEAVFLKSDIFLEQGKFLEASEILEQHVDDFESVDKTDILLELSEIYDELEEFEKVYETLKKIVEYDSANEEALMRICFWAEINGKHEDSIEIHQKIIDETPYNSMAWYNLGVAYQGLKLYEKAIDSYEYCLAIDDKIEYAYRNMGDAYIQLKQYTKAIEVLEMHMSIAKPEDVILEAIGYCFHKQKQYKTARQYYRKASQLNPKDDQIFYKIGETYTKELQWEKAIKAYSVALHINKDNATYCMALGNCLMEMNAEKEALVCFLNAIQLRPDLKSTWISLVKALYTANYLDEALSQLVIAEAHCGHKVEFVYFRAVILLTMGKTKEAVIHLEDALTENPSKQTALKAIEKEIIHHPVFAEVLVRYKKKK